MGNILTCGLISRRSPTQPPINKTNEIIAVMYRHESTEADVDAVKAAAKEMGARYSEVSVRPTVDLAKDYEIYARTGYMCQTGIIMAFKFKEDADFGEIIEGLRGMRGVKSVFRSPVLTKS